MPSLGLSLGLPFGRVTVSDSTPVNTAAPTISFVGTGLVGESVTVSPGTWTNNPTLTYQWRRNEIPLSGETSTNYSLTAGDAGQGVTCVETANGTINVEADAVTPAALAPPTGLNTPSISSSTGLTGDDISMTSTPSASGNPPPTFSFQWMLSGSPVEGETGSTLPGTVTNSAGLPYTIQVIATNSQGSTSAGSNSITLTEPSP